MKTRRSFLSSMLRAGAAFSILPEAYTYERIWNPDKRIDTLAVMLNPSFTISECPTFVFDPQQYSIWAGIDFDSIHREVRWKRLIDRVELVGGQILWPSA